MRQIVDIFWKATCCAAGVFAAPWGLFVYLLSRPLGWNGTGGSKGTRRIGRIYPETAFSPDADRFGTRDARFRALP